MFGLFESKEEKKNKLVSRGMQYMTTGNFNEAEGCFLKAIELDIFNSAEAWFGLGAMYLATDFYKKARDCFETAVDQTKDDFHAIRGLGLAKMKLDDASAVDQFRQLRSKYNYDLNEDPAMGKAEIEWLKDNGY